MSDGLGKKEGHVIMVNSQPPQIDVYSPYAEKLKTVALPGDMTNPLHAVELVMTSPDVTQYVVSHGRNANDLHRVCIVSSSAWFLIVHCRNVKLLYVDTHYGACHGNLICFQLELSGARVPS